MAAIFQGSTFVSRYRVYATFLFRWSHAQCMTICSIGIWVLAGIQVQAQTKNSVVEPLLDGGKSQMDSIQPVTPVAALDDIHLSPDKEDAQRNLSQKLNDWFEAPKFFPRRAEKSSLFEPSGFSYRIASPKGVPHSRHLFQKPAFRSPTSYSAASLSLTPPTQLPSTTFPPSKKRENTGKAFMLEEDAGVTFIHKQKLRVSEKWHTAITAKCNCTNGDSDISISGYNSQLTSHSRLKPSSILQLQQLPVLIAAPENFNPGLRLPPVPPPEAPQPPVAPPTQSTFPSLVIENFKLDFRDDRDNFKQHNQFIEPTAQFRLPNGQRLRFKTGFDSFQKPGYEPVINIPFQFGWQGNIGKYTLGVDAGVDLFDHLPAALNFNANFDAPVYVNLTPENKLKSGLFVSGLFEHGPYKANAQSLDRLITSSRLGPNIFWQIDPRTSFFSLYRWGFYNDGNYEQQSFSRLERKFGSFFVAANLFSWSYKRDREKLNGYFSPPDFLNYNGEIGWEGNIFRFLRCRFTGNFGRQRLSGKYDPGNTYQGRCTAIISPKVEADFGYAYSNIRNLNTGSSAYNSRTFTGQVRVRF